MTRQAATLLMQVSTAETASGRGPLTTSSTEPQRFRKPGSYHGASDRNRAFQVQSTQLMKSLIGCVDEQPIQICEVYTTRLGGKALFDLHEVQWMWVRDVQTRARGLESMD